MTLTVPSKDGVRIAYDVTGEGKAIVLIHGFASSREQNWRSTGWIDRLAGEGFRVVSFDCRGHGKSEKPHSPEAYGEHMVDDILAVMDAANTPTADVMGYSMGAMLAIRLMMQYPERVRRTVVAGQGATYFHEAQSWRNMIAEALLADDIDAIGDRVARRFRIFSSQRGKDPVALAACIRSPRYMYGPDDLKQSQRPVLVVCGEKDDITGPPGPLADAFAEGRAVMLPGKDHMTAVGDPGYKFAVLQFLRE
ncbi:MAG: alpha/beta hydrolase [Alphaproteobacteria bacterium]|nr:alpha/beta hydrolase [Alphaproteobacteria bacterium]